MKRHYRHQLMTKASACGNRNGLHSPNPYDTDCLTCSKTGTYKAAMDTGNFSDPHEGNKTPARYEIDRRAKQLGVDYNNAVINGDFVEAKRIAKKMKASNIARDKFAASLEHGERQIRAGAFDKAIQTGIDVELREALEAIITDIDEYSPNWNDKITGGLAPVLVEIYSIKQARKVLRKTKGESHETS